MTSKCKIPTVSHILADFIILSAPDADLAPRGVSTFLQLAKDIKIPIQESKTCLPSTCALVHGMARDTKDNFLGKRLFPSTTTMVVEFLSTRWTILWPSTITAQLSVVSFVHKLDKKKDPTPSFIIKQLLVGARKLNPPTDSRLPILQPILIHLVNSLSHTGVPLYYQTLLRSVYFLRPGTFTARYNISHTHLLDLSQITLDKMSHGPKYMLLTFVSYKHKQAGKTVTLRVNSSPPFLSSVCSPVISSPSGLCSSPPFFMGPGKSQRNRSQFARYLRQSLIWAGLHHSRYTPHRFRIGAATDAAQSGIPDTKH